MKLDRRYVTIAQELARQLNELGPNTLLPTENDLAAEFGVSRMTVRAALHMLEQNGSVTRVRGRGTIANPRKIVRNAFPMTTIEQDFRQQGIAFLTPTFSNSSAVPRHRPRSELRLNSRISLSRMRCFAVENPVQLWSSETHCRTIFRGLAIVPRPLTRVTEPFFSDLWSAARTVIRLTPSSRC